MCAQYAGSVKSPGPVSLNHELYFAGGRVASWQKGVVFIGFRLSGLGFRAEMQQPQVDGDTLYLSTYLLSQSQESYSRVREEHTIPLQLILNLATSFSDHPKEGNYTLNHPKP